MSKFSASLWLFGFWSRLAARDGVYAVAKRMRKQGIPVEVAVATLARS